MMRQPPEVEIRGIELLMQWKNLMHEAGNGASSSAKIRAFEALEAWQKERTQEDWRRIENAQTVAGKVGRRALVEILEEVEPIGQRR